MRSFRLSEIAADLGIPRHEIIELIGYITNTSTNKIINFDAMGNLELSQCDSEKLEELSEIRKSGTPLQHLTGYAWFYGRQFKVEPGVFIPRPETEVLVEAVLKDAKARLATMSSAGKDQESLNLRILDLCAGSGAIGLTIAAELPDTHVDLVEISPETAKITAENAKLLGVEDCSTIHVIDALDFLVEPEFSNLFDVVVANPPYVPPLQVLQEQGYSLSPEVMLDPPVALFGGGEDGFDLPDSIISRLKNVMKVNATFYIEHYDTQAPLVKNALENAGFSNAKSFTDLNGVPRFTTCTN
jgi:release factor glutamine methyltransferase